ncbi:MAG: 4Fe-4S dicluster domain-containing protein [Anaerolineales bacterium]|nr:4Fe-4S dicluster domain-containing protein [Anaerolineales bacterium]
MLSFPEKIIFILGVLLTSAYALVSGARLLRVIGRGHGVPDWRRLLTKVPIVLIQTINLKDTFRIRKRTSTLHGLIAWGFLFYIIINLSDILEGFIPNYEFLGNGTLGGMYRMIAEITSIFILSAMSLLLLRRFFIKPTTLQIHPDIKLYPKAHEGINKDSLIVGLFILFHVGTRLLGQSFKLSFTGMDDWQPLTMNIATLWQGFSPRSLEFLFHGAWWLSMGSILLFIPYFFSSKHLHLLMTPLNLMLKPDNKLVVPIGNLDFEDQTQEYFGAERIEDLPFSCLVDTYACIMCFRCQDVCPAYVTGKALSPAALEINKRFYLNQEGKRLAEGLPSDKTLLDFAISPEALWACTLCGACVSICPVGNEPMVDILEIRRNQVLMQNRFPEPLKFAFRGMERATNPWGIPVEERIRWASDLDVPTINENPTPDILWWIGCAPALDPQAMKITRAFAKVLNAAKVNYAILGEQESCTGDSARRTGNEYLFYQLATMNIQILNQVKPSRIVTTCPHCLYTLKNEYPAFGGHYTVVHHTEFIQELIDAERLDFTSESFDNLVTYHDPCYLGRMLGHIDTPRSILEDSHIQIVEMSLNKEDSFCCGAGGGQMWKEEERGNGRISANRFKQAQCTGASLILVGCPFCKSILSDEAQKNGYMPVKDIVEVIAERLELS